MIERAKLQTQKDQATSNIIPLILRYNCTFPDIKGTVNKHWDILKINRDFYSLQTKQISERYFWQENNPQQKKTTINHSGYSKPCIPKLNNLCCTQMHSTITFRGTVTHKSFKIYNKLNCKSKYLKYLVECVLCNKQYTNKSEIIFKAKQPSKICK